MFDQQLIRKRIKQLRSDILADPASKEPVWRQWVAELVDLQNTFPEHSTIDFHDAEFAGWDGKKPLTISATVEVVEEPVVEPVPKTKSKRKTPPLKVTPEQIDVVYDQGLEQYQAEQRAEREAEQQKPVESIRVVPREKHFGLGTIIPKIMVKPIVDELSATSTAIVVDAREIHQDIIADVIRMVPEDDRFEILAATLTAYQALVCGDVPLADTLHDIASLREKNGQWMAKALKISKVLRPAYQRQLTGLWDPENQTLELDTYEDGTMYIAVL